MAKSSGSENRGRRENGSSRRPKTQSTATRRKRRGPGPFLSPRGRPENVAGHGIGGGGSHLRTSLPVYQGKNRDFSTFRCVLTRSWSATWRNPVTSAANSLHTEQGIFGKASGSLGPLSLGIPSSLRMPRAQTPTPSHRQRDPGSSPALRPKPTSRGWFARQWSVRDRGQSASARQ